MKWVKVNELISNRKFFINIERVTAISIEDEGCVLNFEGKALIISHEDFYAQIVNIIKEAL